MKIGIIDSGLGGINVLHFLLKQNKTTHYIFYGDYAHNPYGKKTVEELKQYYQEAITFLKSKHCQKILIACNTLATIIDGEDVISPIPFVQEKMKQYHASEICLLATSRTIKSNIYGKGICCDNWVKMIEDDVNSLNDCSIKTDKQVFVLGCTHFSLLKPFLQAQYPYPLIFIDSAYELASHVDKINEPLKIDLYLTNTFPHTLTNIASILKDYSYNIFLFQFQQWKKM